MKSKSDKLRQYEIVVRCLNGERFSKSDLADNYGVEEITINRDLNELRKNRFPIYSRKNVVDLVRNELDEELLVKIISEYCTKKLNSDLLFNKVKVLITNSGINSSVYLALLSKSINEKTEVEIKYQKLGGNTINDYNVQPLEIINNEYNWILIAYHDGAEKNFYINRIKALQLSNKKFEYTRTITDLEIEKIKLRFNPEKEQQVLGKIWFKEFEFYHDDEGYIILTTNQAITHKLAAWCISWWDQIEILEPESLKDHIKNMISAFQRTNF